MMLQPYMFIPTRQLPWLSAVRQAIVKMNLLTKQGKR